PLPGKRTPLDLDGALSWLDAHPSVSLVTDVKSRNVDALARIAERRRDLVPRVLPQVHDRSQAGEARALGYDRLVLTLYSSRLDDAEVLRLVGETSIFAVTLPWARAMESDLPERLSKRGVRTYAHTVNDFLRAAALR